MKTQIYLSTLTMGTILLTTTSFCLAKQDSAEIRLVNTITLQNISGRLGHMAYNNKQQTIYLAALSNNTMEVVDIQNKKTIKSIKSLRQPVDVEYLPNADLIFVACLGDGLCRVFNANTFKEETSFRFDNNVSMVKYSPSFQMIYIGYGEGAIALVDANTLKYKTTIKLSAHPEAVAVDENAGTMFVNLPKIREIGIIELKNNSLLKSFPMGDDAENYPIAYDKDHKRLFIGCRKPAKLLVVNAENGSKIASVDIDGDVNEVFFDNANKQLYVTCGDGYLYVIKQEVREVKQLIQEKKSSTSKQSKTSTKSGSKKQVSKTTKQTKKSSPQAIPLPQPQYRTVVQDNYKTVSRIFTANGARTSLYIPESKQLIVAAPAFADKEARLLIYQLK